MSARSFTHDPRFEPFRLESFDAAHFTSRALSDALSSAQTTGNQLRDDIRQLEDGVQDEVSRKQSELHGVVTGLVEMDAACRSVDDSAHHLGNSVGQLQASLQAPFRRLRVKTTQLRNMRATVETLRGISRRLKLIQKMKKRLGDAEGDLVNVDLPEVARILSDIHNSRSLHEGAEADLEGIGVLDEDRKYVETVTKRVRAHAEMKLMHGQEGMNQAEMGIALHVFFNLSELPAAVEMLTTKKVARMNQKARNAFDFHKLMALSKESGQSSLQESVWTSVNVLIAELEESALAILHLQQVLTKLYDPTTHVCFISVIEGGEHLIDRFWSQAVAIVERSMSHAVQPGKSTPVREVLVHGFPKLCSLLEASVERLSQQSLIKGQVSLPIGSQNLQDLLGSCLPVQSVFATRSLTHMIDTTNDIFPSGSRTIPPSTEIQKLVSVFHEEMKQAESSVHTCRLVANNIANAALLIAEKVEGLAASGLDLRTVGTSCTTAQLRNISLCSSLQEIHKSLVTLISKLDRKGVEVLVPACDTLKTTALGLVTPLFKTFMESLEQLLLEMHTLPTWTAAGDASGAERTPSKHIHDLKNELRTFSMEFLSRFAPPFSPSTPSFVRALVKRMVCRLIVFFVRHASLLRPLSPAGKGQLICDTEEMEHVLTQTLMPVSTLTHHSGTLRAFRELLQSSPSQIRSSPSILELPRNVVLYHLFSYASRELQLPHERIGLTPAQFSVWLDSHSIEEAVQGVQAALEGSAFSRDPDLMATLRDMCRV